MGCSITEAAKSYYVYIGGDPYMPVTKENLHDAFSYHPLDEEQLRKYKRIQEAAEAFAIVALEELGPCGDQQAAIRHIFEAKATLNRAVAVREIV